MTITVYGIKNCDTCRKAWQWLDAQGYDYRFHDLRRDGVPEDRLEQWIERLGWETVINKRGTTWRKLPENVRAHMDAEHAHAQAVEEPALIKRPLLDTGAEIVAGFDTDQWQSMLEKG